MKKLINTIIVFLPLACIAQIGNYNTFPSLPPLHLLDNVDLLEEISFAYSMRLLESDYEGPLVRLRRASDNSERDFFCNQVDKINVIEIDNWRNGANVYVATWYDQSGQNRNAVQSDLSKQPRFFTDSNFPHFAGDGSNDSLIVQGTFNDVVENGKNASITGVFFAVDRSDSAFGAINPSNSTNDRWLTHINWVDEHLYFDPGYCCNNPRRFRNDVPTSTNGPGKLGTWGQYTMLRRNDPANPTIDRIILKLDGVLKVDGDFPDNRAFTRTDFPFLIGALSSNSAGNPTGAATTKFAEMVMYKTGKSDNFMNELEENQLTFWKL